MNKFSIVAMGPGHLNYTTPAAMAVLQKSDTLMGATRLIETAKTHFSEVDLQNKQKKFICVDAGLAELKDYIEVHREQEHIAVMVTGDSGFYSLLGYLSRSFPKEDFDVIPGISSLQYMFSKIKEQWAGAPLMSLHGRECLYVEAIRRHRFVGLLTDKINTPTLVAKNLAAEGLEHVVLHVGSNLSYEDEVLWQGTVENASTAAFSDLCVIILENSQLEVRP